jgi:uncharacterized membrane protein
MMATAFLGYSISPRWLNIIFMIIFFIIYIFVFLIHKEIIKDIKNENNKNKIKNYLKSNKINLIGYKIIRNYSMPPALWAGGLIILLIVILKYQTN